jgi:hypothetical protein
MLSGSGIRWARKYRSSPYPLQEGYSGSPIFLLLGLYVSFSDYVVKRYAVSRRRENQRGWMMHNILLNSHFAVFLYQAQVKRKGGRMGKEH